MNEAKIRLSPKEMELVTQTDWILTKNAILVKARHLLLDLLEKQKEYLETKTKHLPDEILKTSPKISRGENYKGLPYVVLDHPRLFRKEDVFAIRTMFWWGNFFSITLQLSGRYKKKFAEKIIAAYSSWRKNGYFICRNEDPWEHHFDEDNYIQVKDLSKGDFENRIRDHSFVKLAQKSSLHQWDHAPAILLGHFKQVMEALT